MFLIVVTALLFAVAIGSYIYGAYRLSQFAFRVDQTKGLLVLLCPPYTFYFAFAQLNESGKETPTAAAAFGLLATALLLVIFWTPITLVATGQMSQLTPPSENVAESMSEEDNNEQQAGQKQDAEKPKKSADASAGNKSKDTESSGETKDKDKKEEGASKDNKESDE